MYIASVGVLLHKSLKIVAFHLLSGDEEELRLGLGFVLNVFGGTLQKGQLKMLPSTSLRQHFQQIWVWLQGGRVQYWLSSQQTKQVVVIL